MKIKTFIEDFVKTATTYIEKYEECKELSGEERKKRLDDIVSNYVEVAIENIGLNFVFKFVLKKLLIQNIPYITQAIFNLIQTRIKGITK